MSIAPPRRIWLWQNIFSPHMAGLAVALARRGCEVTYVAEQALTADRAQQGWLPPSLEGVTLKLMRSAAAVDELVASAPPDGIHICSGIRSNGMVAVAQRALGQRRLCQWVVMETVDDVGWRGVLKRLAYRRLFMQKRQQVQGVLAIGHRTPGWVAARGVPPDRVYPFAYFLPGPDLSLPRGVREAGPFRFVFAGQLIPRKRVDWLINALAALPDPAAELWIVGGGPDEPALRALVDRGLGDRVRWLGQMPLPDVPDVLAQADCLVLPSVHDGWGAVVSEALMVGTPVICSDACGAAGVVWAGGAGGVFPAADRALLALLLEQALAGGPVTTAARLSLAGWAECLCGQAGADYLLRILDHADGRPSSASRPLPPWSQVSTAPCAEARTDE
ncbi:glycosyltransferase family 4 protein [Casimicrobium huifangae]|uniref:glycosyltransferase family 4 protein n=1 Tax=Casimicrobium huifangae TaxID=2591109 RepID=UPI001396C00F|nr:glycosyltransferase family 4 protein [Casimicrobium huifangae]